jgi:hypothetical protein
MKKLLLTFIAIFDISLTMFSQTAGTLTFTFLQNATTSTNGNTANRNVLAVWIEDNSGTFIKTRARYVNSTYTTSIQDWAWASGPSFDPTSALCNINGATIGSYLTVSSTPTAFGTKTIYWDGTDALGNIVPDGTYKIHIESDTYSGSYYYKIADLHWFISFTKSGTIYSANSGTQWSINWTPSATTAIEDQSTKSDFSIYPNPSQGIFNFTSNEVNNIKVYNVLGEIVYEEKTKSELNVTTINLSFLTNGIYYISINSKSGFKTQKIILNK